MFFFLLEAADFTKKSLVLTADSLLGTNSSLELRPRPRSQSVTQHSRARSPSNERDEMRRPRCSS